MNSFYSVCKRKSRQMTELVLIGLLMVLFVIASSWGTKIINYLQGPVSILNNKHDLTKDPHKDSFDFNDPQNQFFKMDVSSDTLIPIKQEKQLYYYTYQIKNKENISIVLDEAQNKWLNKKLENNQVVTIKGGFDVLTAQELKIVEPLETTIHTLIFRMGNIGDSQLIEITVSIYSTIIIIILMIVMIILEAANVYLYKTKQQLEKMIEEKKALIDEDFKERLKKNRISFGDNFLYLSKNWHYEIYPFEDLVLLHYHVHRYGNFNRYTLVGWNVDKNKFVISSMLTKEKITNLIKLIYERNPEITVEKTMKDTKIQLHYFDFLVQEMRDRQDKSKQLLDSKNSQPFHQRKNKYQVPIEARMSGNRINHKRKTTPVIHKQRGPLK